MEHQKCTIIGAGPAGYTTAIYAARANLNPVMLTGIQPGGQLMITNEVENLPGYPKGVNGPQMMEELISSGFSEIYAKSSQILFKTSTVRTIFAPKNNQNVLPFFKIFKLKLSQTELDVTDILI